RTLTSAGGSTDRTMVWDYYPDGKLKSRSDSGTPVGKHEIVVDNSDSPRVTYTGSGATRDTSGTGYQGFDYHRAPDGTFTWNPVVPVGGTYEVFARYPAGANATQAATYTVDNGTTRTAKTVDQTQGGGTWVSLGNHQLTAGTTTKIELAGGAAAGDLLADAVKLVRDNTGVPDAEAKTFSHGYDANANLTTLTDSSPGTPVDTYAMTYNGLNQLTKVEEKLATTIKNTTLFTYNENGAIKTRDHDRQDSVFDYNTRDLLDKVTNTETGGTPKITAFTYTPRGQLDIETKANGNTVDHGYHLDGALATQIENKTDGTLVAQHLIEYTPNGNRATDHTKIQNADNHTAYLDHIYNYTYDPRERLSQVQKKNPTSGAVIESETYRHDANNNVIDQTVDGTQTQYTYDRNRLVTTTSGGVTGSYNYDPFGRLDTVFSAGQIIEHYVYDGFDRTTKHRALDDTGAIVDTTYTYDPLDRTTTKTDKAGTPEAKTTDFAYLGLTDKVVAEEIAGQLDRTYQYDAYGRRLTQQKKDTDGSGPEVAEDAYYGYNPHTDVETLTTAAGDTKATYGYTAYGSNDTESFTGIDKPDTQNPGKEPFNFYRYTGKRFDPASGGYDMGFRDYQPGINRFTVRDTYNGALADMKLGTSTWTGNRYSLAGGNPITGVEIDGHIIYLGDGSASIPRAAASDTTIAAAAENAARGAAVVNRSGGTDMPYTPTDSSPYKELSTSDQIHNSDLLASQSMLLAEGVGAVCAMYDELACALWNRYADHSGADFIVDPSELVKDPDFGDRVSEEKDVLVELATAECRGQGRSVCTVAIDSRWRDGQFENNDSHKFGIGNFKFRIRGQIEVSIGSDGTTTAKGKYSLDMYKDWNFDRNKSVFGGLVSLEQFAMMPGLGIAREFAMYGTSTMEF
ncbi:RHS repeat-associated core domain-containing protein, partial [Actinophytocola sp. NPDC049390]|uniref:golvesin C-terminal-like domain-containing protein n=1 Tax=Actinophytocola sp. NPDC049390 TaxID=3363894 RepID=UPI0037B0E444